MSPAAEHRILPWEHPLGARPTAPGSVTFRVWAPDATHVGLRLDAEYRDQPMASAGGIWELTHPARHGDDYRFVVDGTPWPDPCSRWQPHGLRGPSRVVDPSVLPHAPRPVLDRAAQVLYELHIGTFTEAGTFAAAAEQLPALRDLGITAIELMPVNEFPGRHGWGYDGVYPGAAQSSYGGPVELARLVAEAHRLGLGVILDVVYNHVGPTGADGLAAFGPYFTRAYHTAWGDAPNLDGPGSGPVREWMLQSAEWWIRDVGIDGLRVDALHAIVDGSARHLCAELTDRVRAIHPGALLIAESGLNDPRTITPTTELGWGFDADWADDFHHALRTVLTADRDGWLADYGEPDQLARAFVDPYLFAGDFVPFRDRRFGADGRARAIEQFVVFAQNHDQIGNRALGDRLPLEARPLAALCLLFSAATPMLFMGEEYGEEAPFQYFTDHIDPDIAEATRAGRRREFARGSGFEGDQVPDPQSEETFLRSKLTRKVDPELLALHKTLIALRRQLPPGRPDLAVAHDGQLRVVRGHFELVAAIGRGPVHVDLAAGRLVVAAGPAEAQDDRLLLHPGAGAVVEHLDPAAPRR